MIKNWKSLFVKDEDKEPEKPAETTPSFPVGTTTTSFPTNTATARQADYGLSPEVKEVVEVYEKGLDSINMPGYDFYEFYKAVNSAGVHNETAYQMAYQMAKTMDNTVTTQKLAADAEFYISKINEVHGQYVSQGQQKLTQLSSQKLAEKNDLNKSIDETAMRLANLRAELAQLETDIQKKREALAKIEDKFTPEEQAIKSKLMSNDLARSSSIAKLTSVKEYIQKFIKIT